MIVCDGWKKCFAGDKPEAACAKCPHGDGGNSLAIPFQDWPTWAKNIYAEREIPTDKGVGDTTHRRLGDGGIIFAAWVALLGIPCGCAQRRDDWNMLYPYGDK